MVPLSPESMDASTMRQKFAFAVLIGAFVAVFATSASAAPLQKPDQIRGNCGSDDTYFPPDSNGAYACLKKDGGGITCGGASEEYKKTCEIWSASGTPPSWAPGAVRGAAQKKAEKAAADKAAADKAKADKAAADKAAADKAAAEKAKASKPTADKPTTDKQTTDKPTTDKPSAKQADNRQTGVRCVDECSRLFGDKTKLRLLGAERRKYMPDLSTGAVQNRKRQGRDRRQQNSEPVL